MPIYEFKCLECNEINEFLFMNSEDTKEMKCSHCGGQDMERVMSCSNFNVSGSPSQKKTGATGTTQNCASGSCGTLEIPGIGD